MDSLIYFPGYQFWWMKENLHICGYLISWFCQSLHISLKKICLSLNFYFRGSTVPTKATEIIMNPQYTEMFMTSTYFQLSDFLWNELQVMVIPDELSYCMRFHCKIEWVQIDVYYFSLLIEFYYKTLYTKIFSKSESSWCSSPYNNRLAWGSVAEVSIFFTHLSKSTLVYKKNGEWPMNRSI